MGKKFKYVRTYKAQKPKHFNPVASKARENNRQRFYLDIIKYVKKRQGGYISPADTSYSRLVSKLESYTGIVNGEGSENALARCQIAADHLGIPVKLKKHKTNLENRDERCNFYSSLAWKKLRYATITKYGATCQCCGANGPGTKIRVDHIKPVSKFWHLRLDPNNLQVLCEDCNWGKLNIDQTDWRLSV